MLKLSYANCSRVIADELKKFPVSALILARHFLSYFTIRILIFFHSTAIRLHIFRSSSTTTLLQRLLVSSSLLYNSEPLRGHGVYIGKLKEVV